MNRPSGDNHEQPEAKIIPFRREHPSNDERLNASRLTDEEVVDVMTSFWSHPAGDTNAVITSVLYHCGVPGSAPPAGKGDEPWRQRVQDILGKTYRPDELKPDPRSTQPAEYAFFLLECLLQTPAVQTLSNQATVESRRQRIIKKMFPPD